MTAIKHDNCFYIYSCFNDSKINTSSFSLFCARYDYLRCKKKCFLRKMMYPSLSNAKIELSISLGKVLLLIEEV